MNKNRFLPICNKYMFILVTSYYESPNADRQKEIDECLRRNIQNPSIDRIYLLNGRIYSLSHLDPYGKVVQILVPGMKSQRLYFNYAIQWINDHLQGKHVILSNSDIYFDQTLLFVKPEHLDHSVFALTRYDNGKIEQFWDSQDSWIFQSPLLVPMIDCMFSFGTLGCDNRLAHVIKEAGYRIRNPCFSIKSHHLHASNERTYDISTRLSPPYHLVEHTSL